MKINVIKENKIIRQENEGYIAKEGEILLSANDIDWPILKRTGGQFLEINKDDKLENDIISGGVVRFNRITAYNVCYTKLLRIMLKFFKGY